MPTKTHALATLMVVASTIIVTGCTEASPEEDSKPKPHEMSEVDQRSWARQVAQEQYQIEGDMMEAINLGFENSANFCAAAKDFDSTGEFSSRQDYWEDGSQVLGAYMDREALLASLHIGYAIDCPVIAEEYMEWRQD